MHCVSRGGCYLVNSYCDLQEENERKKESYEACWLSLVLETRPQYKYVALIEICCILYCKYMAQTYYSLT